MEISTSSRELQKKRGVMRVLPLAGTTALSSSLRLSHRLVRGLSWLHGSKARSEHAPQNTRT